MKGPPPSPQPGRSGFTLLEVVVALSIISVLLASLGSVVVLASRAIPSTASAAGTGAASAAALDQMVSELKFATGVVAKTSTAIEFKVPDRTGDGNADTIRYEWGGIAGGPLVRTFNGVAANLLANLDQFSLVYQSTPHTTSTSTTTTWDSGEVQLAGFTAWSGITPTQSTTALSTTTWAAERFTIDRVSLPADTTKLTISRISLRLKKPAAGTAGATISVHLPSAAGASTPVATTLGTPFSVPAASMSTTIGWVDATFSDVSFNDISNQSFVIVAKGIAASSATIQYLTSASAPADNGIYRYSSNSGSTWLPSSNLNYNDAPFAVYGSYQRKTTSTGNVTTYTLDSVSISLTPSGRGATRLDTSVETLNEPSLP